MKSFKVASNSIINLSTQIIPIFIALIFIPISIEALGSELFGIFSLIITFIVLFNYLNFGIAPATTKELARYLAKNNIQKTISILINSFIIMLSIGILFSIIFLFFNEEIASLIVKNRHLQPIVISLLKILAILSPLVMIVIFLRSTLEAKQLFIVTSLNRALLNSAIFIAPTICFIDNLTIVNVFELLIIVYSISIILLSYFVYKSYFLEGNMKFSFKDSKILFQVGFWMMLSSIAGIGLYYIDRFIISAVVSVIAVAYYVTAYDLVTRLNIISGSITSAFFPAFTHWFEIDEKHKIIEAVIFILKIILFIVSLISFLFIIFSKEILLVWINREYSISSYLILQLLTIGVLFNTLSVIPFRTLSAIGFQKIVALIYIIEMPFAIILSYFFIKNYNLIGAAIAYDLRAFVESSILYYILVSKKIDLGFKINIFSILKIIFVFVVFIISAFFISISKIFLIKVCLSIIIILIFMFTVKSVVFNNIEKEKIKRYIYKVKEKF